jgi:hypothetical protein
MKWSLFLILSFSLFVVPVVSGQEEAPPEPTLYAGEELDPELAAMLLEKLEGNEDVINTYIEDAGIPAPLKGFTSGRYNLHIGDDTIGVVMEDGKLEEVAEGGIENPTTDIYADEELIEKIATSDDPVGAILEAQKTGELRKEDHGLVPKIKGFLMNIALKILDLVS